MPVACSITGTLHVTATTSKKESCGGRPPVPAALTAQELTEKCEVVFYNENPAADQPGGQAKAPVQRGPLLTLRSRRSARGERGVARTVTTQ